MKCNFRDFSEILESCVYDSDRGMSNNTKWGGVRGNHMHENEEWEIKLREIIRKETTKIKGNDRKYRESRLLGCVCADDFYILD